MDGVAPVGRDHRCTVISLRVSVPVLSEQMIGDRAQGLDRGQPADDRMAAAMRRTPIASVMVITAGRPSGITATARPTTAMKASATE